MDVYVLLKLLLLHSCTGLRPEWSEDGIGPPDWESDWLFMRSQDEDYSYRIRRHDLGEVPFKVRVYIRVLSGEYEGFVFEAAPGGAMWDDDKPIVYCGVSYVFSDTSIKLHAPQATNAMTSGRIICAGGQSWGGGPLQEMREAEVKVLAWLQSSFPRPQFLSPWLNFNQSQGLLELPHNITGDCSYMMVQVQGESESRHLGIWYGEAVGASQDPYDIFDRGAVVFGYNDSLVRIWRTVDLSNKEKDRRFGACLLCIRDGWTNKRRLTIVDGLVRVVGWQCLASPLQHVHRQMMVHASMPAFKVPILRGNLPLEPHSLFISVQIQALDGSNAGFRFPAFGVVPAMPSDLFPGRTYGGVVYSVKGTELWISLPTDNQGYVVLIKSPWGAGTHEQASKKGKLIVNARYIGPSLDKDKCYFSRIQQKADFQPAEVEADIKCGQQCCAFHECLCMAYSVHRKHCTILKDISQVNSQTQDSVFLRN